MQKTSRTKIIRFASIISALSLTMVACTGAFDDPFVSPKQGSVTQSQAVNLADQASIKIFMFRVGHHSDTMIEAGGVTRLKEGLKVEWNSLSVVNLEGKITTRSYAELAANSKCVDGYPDVKELMTQYPSIIPICDKELIDSLNSASSIVVKTKDGEEMPFSSWNTRQRSIGLTNTVIFSVTL